MIRVTLLSLSLVLLLSSPTAHALRLVFSSEDPEERNNEFVLDVGNDFDVYSLRFGDDTSAALTFNQITDKFSFNRDVDLGGNELQNFRLEQLAAAPTCDAANSGRMYFDTDDNQVYSCDGTSWYAFQSSVYEGYSVENWDQTDGSESFIGRTKDLDNKWLITRSFPGGFAYAQIENNAGTPDFTTAWTNRASLTYSTSFTP